MPNHVLNVVEFYCDEEKAAEIRRFMQNDTENREFDFNRLIPMPEHIFRGDLGREEREKYGEDNWYDWSIRNWGTKWNAYDVSWGTNSVEFLTAWSSVPELIQILSKCFPDVGMIYKWADEDTGYNVGTIELKNGEVISTDIPMGGSKEAYDMAFAIHDASPEDFGYYYNEHSCSYEYKDE